MDPAATKEARLEALNRAKQHNLEVASIARETVRLTLEEAFAVSLVPVYRAYTLAHSSDHSGSVPRAARYVLLCNWPDREGCPPNSHD